jgi:hypothetical protein
LYPVSDFRGIQKRPSSYAAPLPLHSIRLKLAVCCTLRIPSESKSKPHSERNGRSARLTCQISTVSRHRQIDHRLLSNAPITFLLALTVPFSLAPRASADTTAATRQSYVPRFSYFLSLSSGNQSFFSIRPVLPASQRRVQSPTIH